MKNKSLCLIALVSVLVPAVSLAQERIVLLDEGTWQADNGRISYFENGQVVSNQWFRDVNGTKLGDTPNDIVAVNDNLMAIAVNWSNIVQFITDDCKAVGATEDVPNNRCLASDGEYVYVTSYAHECGIDGQMVQFTKGYVAKIETTTFKVVAACEVGYEPEGIAYYDGHLFVANSGGYSFQEDHNYEQTVSVIDAASMKVVRTVDTGQINLYGHISQVGKYLCFSSPGDYYSVSAATIIMDCEATLAGKPDKECSVRLPFAGTYSCATPAGLFYAIGSSYSYVSGGYEFSYITIDPSEVMESAGEKGIGSDFPGTFLEDLKKVAMPYGVYVNPYTGYIYATDAASYNSAGFLMQWSPEGTLLGTHKVYINPSHMLALKPEGYSGIENVSTSDAIPVTYYNLEGMSSDRPFKGFNIVRSANGSTRKICFN